LRELLNVDAFSPSPDEERRIAQPSKGRALPWYYVATMSLPQSKYPRQSKPRPKRKSRPSSSRVPKAKPVAETKILPQSKVTAQGQISVPAEIRRQLGILPGSVLEWEVKDNTVVVRRKGKYTFEDIHRAVFKTPPTPHTIEEMKAAIGDHLRKKHARH
jgi:antitoxin PrlF